MASYSLKEISDITEGTLYGTSNAVINHLITDSRVYFSPSDSIFISIKGDRHDGHQYIAELIEKKLLKYFLVEYIPDAFRNNEELNFIVVRNSLHALQKLAATHRSRFKNPVVGITGSNGKTITKEWLYELLHQDKRIVRSPKSFNSQIGVPLSVWLLEDTDDLGIFEAGISKNGEMAKLEQIIKPDIGIFTNISDPHQENFKSIDEKIGEKLILFKNSKKLIYCRDYQNIERKIKELKHKPALFSWSGNTTADLQITKISKSIHSCTITGIFKKEQIQIEIPFTDDASVENAIHCWLFMLVLGINQNFITERMRLLSPVAMRLEQKKGFGNCTIINDSYNSDFHSLSIALDFLNQQQQHPVKTLILSDILQSGKDEKVLYMEVANLIKNKKINKFIGIGTSLFKYSDLFIGASRFFKTTEEFLKSFPRQSFQNEAILIKGSRKFEFEKISSLLEQKTHRTILEINLNAMIANLNYFKRKLNPSTKIMAMVKALSYGSGSYEIANMLEFQKTDYLAVAFADEGVALRQAGIGLPIVVMNPEEGNYELMIDYHLEMEVYSFRELLLITNALKALRVSNFPVHLKLNTGMNRLGFDHDEIDELIHNLEKNESIKVMSIFSHMAASDEKEHDDFTRLQIRRFDEMSLKLISALGYPVLRHILNSSGIERFPSAQYDMVRLGIGLYGVGCDENKNALQSVSNLKSYISQIRKVPANETVGYSRNGKTDQEISVGIVPIGYADGYSRRMGNGVGRMYVNGAYAPVVGNICMDMCMINLTGLNVQEGDKVIIFGEKIPISEISEKMQTNPYEILTGISQRVKRVYFQE